MLVLRIAVVCFLLDNIAKRMTYLILSLGLKAIQQLFNTNDGKKRNEAQEDPSINLKWLGESELSI